jgi:hypothetical protein
LRQRKALDRDSDGTPTVKDGLKRLRRRQFSPDATASRSTASFQPGIALVVRVLLQGKSMSGQAVITSLCGLALVAACGRHRPAPTPAAELDRDPGCPHPDTVAQRDSGIALGHDVSRGARYRVDSAGRVETLPPVPAAGTDTARPGCPP